MASDPRRIQQPFYPGVPQQPQRTPAPQQPQYQYSPAPAPVPSYYPECANCGSRVKEGERSISMMFGVMGTLEQTGLPGVTDPPGKRCVVVVIHEECCLDFAITEVNQDKADEMLYEAASELAQEMMQGMEEDADIEDQYRRRLDDEHS